MHKATTLGLETQQQFLAEENWIVGCTTVFGISVASKTNWYERNSRSEK